MGYNRVRSNHVSYAIKQAGRRAASELLWRGSSTDASPKIERSECTTAKMSQLFAFNRMQLKNCMPLERYANSTHSLSLISGTQHWNFGYTTHCALSDILAVCWLKPTETNKITAHIQLTNTNVKHGTACKNSQSIRRSWTKEKF